MILWSGRLQFRQLGWKNIEQRPIFLRSMFKNDGKKLLTKIFSTQTGLFDKQKTVLTTGPSNFRRNDRKMLLNDRWWKRRKTLSKKFCKTSPWTRGKQLWQTFRLFFDEKKADDSLFMFGRTWKKHKQKFCQNKVMSTNWSSGPVECSFVKLTGNV